MRPTAIKSVFLILGPVYALQIPSIFAPFYEPHIEDALLASNQSSAAIQYELLKRQSGSGGCPLNFNPCTKDGYRGACCTVGSTCTTDSARNVACCPNGMKCTGLVTAGATASISGGSTGGAVFESPATTTSNPATTTATGPVAVITNPYFPFPVIATTYSNSAACNTAYEACQTNYRACTANLEGAGFGVTIVAPQGGVTVAPTAQNLGSASATSICSSLSQQACYGIVSANCAQFGQGTGGSFIAGPSGNWAARPTVGCLAAAGLMAGVGIGVAGQIL